MGSSINPSHETDDIQAQQKKQIIHTEPRSAKVGSVNLTVKKLTTLHHVVSDFSSSIQGILAFYSAALRRLWWCIWIHLWTDSSVNNTHPSLVATWLNVFSFLIFPGWDSYLHSQSAANTVLTLHDWLTVQLETQPTANQQPVLYWRCMIAVHSLLSLVKKFTMLHHVVRQILLHPFKAYLLSVLSLSSTQNLTVAIKHR